MLENDNNQQCFIDIPQHYLICITIHKARNLSVFNANTFVEVKLNKFIKTTSIFRNSDSPFFNEYFVFELHTRLYELLRCNVILTVYRLACCHTRKICIGELILDLTTVWNQPNHSFYKKWGKLENSLGSTEKSDFARGFLQIDLSIVTKYDEPYTHVTQTVDYDDIEHNQLQIHPEIGSKKINYLFKLYRGQFIHKKHYAIRISFAGCTGTTKQTHRTNIPKWNELIKIMWFYPSLCQTIFFEILSKTCCCCSQVICYQELNLFNLINNENDNEALPAFGPTYLHFYDNNKKNLYIGKILLEIGTEILDEKIGITRKSIIKTIPTIQESDFWDTEKFYIYFGLLQIDFIHTQSNTIHIQLVCGDTSINYIELTTNRYVNSLLSYVHFPTSVHPLAKLELQQPDYHLKFILIILLEKINKELLYNLTTYKFIELKNLKNLKIQQIFLLNLIRNLLAKLEQFNIKLKNFHLLKTLTEYDKNRNNYLTTVMGKTIKMLENNKKLLSKPIKVDINSVLRDLELLQTIFEEIITNILQDQWPKLIINLMAGKTIIACYVTNPREYFYSETDDSQAILCGKRHNILFKNINCEHNCNNCGCIYGRADVFLWIGNEKDKKNYLPYEWQEKIDFNKIGVDCKTENYFNCNLYIHQAKIKPGINVNGLCDARLQVTFNNWQSTTEVIYDSLSPIWNEVISFNNLKLVGYSQSYKLNPPLIMLELFDINKKHKLDDIIGYGYITPSVKLADDKNELKVLYQKEATANNVESDVTEDLSAKSLGKEEMINKIKKLPIAPTKNLLKKIKNIKPVINIESYENLFPPPLKWVKIVKNGIVYAEVLISAELLQISKNDYLNVPESVKKTVSIPPEICPVMKKFRLEALFAGLRNIKGFMGRTAGHYKIEINFGELILKSGISSKSYGKCYNFLDPFAAGYVSLPEQFEYWPPIILKHLDCSSKKKEKVIGVTMVSKSAEHYIEDIQRNQITMNNIINVDTDIEMGLSDGEALPLIATDEINTTINNVKNNLTNKENFRDRMKSKIFTMRNDTKALIKTKQNNIRLNFVKVKKKDDKNFNWWTKYYNSIDFSGNTDDESNGIHTLKIYEDELEYYSEFNNLTDWASPFYLFKGTSHDKQTFNSMKKAMYALLKCGLTVKTCENDMSFESGKTIKNYASARHQQFMSLINETPVTVRVYVVKGINLRSKDSYGNSDAYVHIEYGGHKITDRQHYVPNQPNPIFGKCFTVHGVLPKDMYLKVSLYDRDPLCCCDDLIGTTIIDIEDRLRTQHNAMCGIANEYNKIGYNKWRNPIAPSEMLRQLCKKHNLSQPQIVGNKIQVGNITFDDTTKISTEEDINERLCLSVLKNFQQLTGIQLVPEHVETRALFHDKHPDIEQGKIQLWLELFDTKQISEPIDLVPHAPELFELRCIVWNTVDVVLNEENIFGKSMSDIYVKGWLYDTEAAQYTDINFRSMTGEGFFNWRMIFPINYSVAENMMVITTPKTLFQTYANVIKVPPTLTLQIWDNDSLSADDFLGSLNINIANFLNPPTNSADCSLKMKNKGDFIDLFEEKTVRGWFAFQGIKRDGTIGQTGKVELELQILTEDEAVASPAGKGREPPAALPEPNRPESSFAWYRNPFKSIKSILLPEIKHLLIYCCIITIVIAIIILFVMTIPGRTFGFMTSFVDFFRSSDPC